jgi:hypothetical protein
MCRRVRATDADRVLLKIKVGPSGRKRAFAMEHPACAEATFSMRNCPGAKMDVNHDGVPCEWQWCN